MDNNALPEAIGLRIKNLREKNGETQKDLARVLDCNQNNISKLESGKSLTPGNLILIAEHYNVTLDYLCKGEVENELLNILTKYISFSYKHISSLSIMDESAAVPSLQINEALFEYLVQVKNAEEDRDLPEDLKNKWREIEQEKFKYRVQSDTNANSISMIPIPENVANKFPDILLLLSSPQKS